MAADAGVVGISTQGSLRGRSAPLSQAVIAGIAMLSDALAACLPTVAVYAAYVGSDIDRNVEYAAVTVLATLLIVLAANAWGLYRFPVIPG